jgi:cyanoexosortase B
MQQTISPNRARAWSDLAVLGLLGLMYLPVILHWCHGWISKSISLEHEYFSHGLIGLPYAGYLVWQKRHRWQQLPGGTGPFQGVDRWAGLAIVFGAGLLYLIGLPETVNLSFPVMLIGCSLWLKGLAGLRLMAFALLFIGLSTPNEIPYLIAPLTLPLQSFIAGTAGLLLNLLGFNVTIEGIHLFMNNRQVEVAPYCAGLKMLFTSLYVAVMLLHWTQLWRSRRIVGGFLAATVVISVSSNIIRNTILTYFHGTAQDAAFKWLHDGWGGDAYSALMLGLLVLLINKIEDWQYDRASEPADYAEPPPSPQ